MRSTECPSSLTLSSAIWLNGILQSHRCILSYMTFNTGCIINPLFADLCVKICRQGAHHMATNIAKNTESLNTDIYSASKFKFPIVMQQEVWPPGLANTVCPRPPLMTHVVARIKKRQRWDVQTIWPWPLTLEVTTIVGHRCLGTSEYQVQILVILRLFVSDLWAIGQHGSDWSRDLATLTFDLWGHGDCCWCGSSSSIRTLTLRFVGLAIWNIWRMMCVSINGPGDLDLWLFDLETAGMRVASKMGNLTSKFGHARPLDSRIIRYIYTRRTDRRTDRQKQRLFLLLYGTGHNKGRNKVYWMR